ncbi:MAG: SH3 domain-containing protein [Proteobacteria bacterium]|nr:SH3 domain-containing protein [Pseudomonadota bacterium]
MPGTKQRPIAALQLNATSAMRLGLALGLGLISLLLPVPDAQADGDRAVVQVNIKESKLRTQPKFWSSTVADLKYSESLTLLGSESGWLKVRTKSGAQGYLHSSAVTTKKIVLAGKASVGTQADAAEVALAGKGFSREVEREYALSNPELNFKAVNAIEQVRVSDQELLAFLREGKLGKGAL